MKRLHKERKRCQEVFVFAKKMDEQNDNFVKRMNIEISKKTRAKAEESKDATMLQTTKTSNSPDDPGGNSDDDDGDKKPAAKDNDKKSN